MMSPALDIATSKPPGRETPLVLALDIGTSSVRGALYDEEGSEIEGTQARVTRRLSTTADGGAQLDARAALAETARTIDEVLVRSANFRARIETVAVACFWHSLVGISAEGEPVTPVFGWADMRAARQAEILQQRLDEKAAHAQTGCRFHPTYWPARLLWLREEQREIYERVQRWMTFAELLTFAFFGETAMSVSMASGTGLLNLRSCQWDATLLETIGVARDQLPLISKKHAPFSRLKNEYARRWPRLQEARWFPAIGDGAANNIGAGCTTRARVALMIGTSGAMRICSEDDPPAEMHPALWCYRADERRVVVGGALSDGGGLYSWMTDALAVSADALERESALRSMSPDAHGLTILPFWAGERSTNWSTRARGAILGLTMHTRPLEILRAAMEAISYRFALIDEAIQADAPAAQIVASGGALAASSVWAQMMADVLGRPVYLSGVAEASSRGACLLALEARGLLKSIETAPAQFVQVYEPEMAHHARYRAGLERQQEIYARLSTAGD
jgi:gluconokinase